MFARCHLGESASAADLRCVMRTRHRLQFDRVAGFCAVLLSNQSK